MLMFKDVTISKEKIQQLVDYKRFINLNKPVRFTWVSLVLMSTEQAANLSQTVNRNSFIHGEMLGGSIMVLTLVDPDFSLIPEDCLILANKIHITMISNVELSQRDFDLLEREINIGIIRVRHQLERILTDCYLLSEQYKKDIEFSRGVLNKIEHKNA